MTTWHISYNSPMRPCILLMCLTSLGSRHIHLTLRGRTCTTCLSRRENKSFRMPKKTWLRAARMKSVLLSQCEMGNRPKNWTITQEVTISISSLSDRLGEKVWIACLSEVSQIRLYEGLKFQC